jgi:hypothetical protein
MREACWSSEDEPADHVRAQDPKLKRDGTSE